MYQKLIFFLKVDASYKTVTIHSYRIACQIVYYKTK